MTDQSPPDLLVLERDMAAPPAKVWRALTESALIADWFMANDFEAEAGRPFTMRATPMPHWDGIVTGEVIAVEPGTRISYSLNSGGFETVVVLTLAPSGNGTLLRMEQSGFAAGQMQNYQGAKYGWERNLAGAERVAAALD